MSVRPALVVAALVAGCQFDGGFGDGLLCPTGECPAGQVCGEGVCSSVGATADAGLPTDGGNRADAAEGADGGLGPNLVANPGMEDGIDPWTPYNAALTEKGDPHSGQKALGVCNAELTGDFTVYQDVLEAPDEPIPVGQGYTASVWVRAVTSAAVPGRMKITIRESGGAVERADHDGTIIDEPGDTWVQLQASGTVQESDRENLILIVWGYESQTGDCFAVDDAVLRAQ